MSTLRRPPVVVVLGHVDHGKTTLLDAIRRTSVQSGEAGGITQHISSSMIEWNDQPITFIDTPGHEVFGLMRSTGGKIADIAVLVVAASEGVKQQTVESIQIIQDNSLKCIVAITKVDVPGADPQKVRNELSSKGIYVEGYGGDIPIVEVAAPKNQGVEELLNTILLYAEVEDVTNPDHAQLFMEEYIGKKIPAQSVAGYGRVLDSKVIQGRGKTGYFILQYGEVKPKQFVVMKDQSSTFTAIADNLNQTIKEAKAGYPFSLAGLNFQPFVGEEFILVNDLKTAQQFTRASQPVAKEIEGSELTEEEMMDSVFAINTRGVFPLVLKADTQTTLQSITQSLEKQGTPEMEVKVLFKNIGDINFNDIDLAESSEALVLGFNVKLSKQIEEYAEQKKVTVKTVSVVYELLDFIEDRLHADERKEQAGVIARGTVKQVFTLSEGDVVAGIVLQEGVVTKKLRARVRRDNQALAEGLKIRSLKVMKTEKESIKAPTECGVNLGPLEDLKPDDIIEFYQA